MSKELRLHIKKLKKRAVLSLFAILSTIIFIIFGIMFLIVSYIVAFILFMLAAICIAYLICYSRTAKKDEKSMHYTPISFNINRNLSFGELSKIFETLTDEKNQLSTFENVRFFRLRKILNLRAILYKTVDFTKEEFKNAKDQINKNANKELNISQWAYRPMDVKKMRINIIYTDMINDELYHFIAQNARHNLSRVEGVINIVVADAQIMIPPLFGECSLIEIRRYKNVIKFINQVLLKNNNNEN